MWLLVACSSPIDIEPQYRSIASLRNEEDNNRATLITDNITLVGMVTANDEYREFYNSLIVEDQSGAVKIICEANDLYLRYSFGEKVEVHCAGLYLLNRNGALTIGSAPTGEYTLDFIPQSKLGHYIKNSELTHQIYAPWSLMIAELTPLHLFRCVELINVTITNIDGVTKFCQRDYVTGQAIDTTHILTDQAGNSIELRVDRLCRYANDNLPTGPSTITAIVNCYSGGYYLTITNSGY